MFFATRVAAAVAVAQLVESRIVIPVVVGSNPISHPISLFDCAFVIRAAGPLPRRELRSFWGQRSVGVHF